QSRLLRVLQTGELERVGSSQTRRVNVRVIAATNADLKAEVASGRFREDLLFRINTIEIRLPPLRDRREDILPLAQYFLKRHSARYGKPRGGFTEEAALLLRGYEWPGNVRELDHAVERAVLLARQDVLEAADFALAPTAGRLGTTDPAGMNLEELERDAIRQALARHDGNVSLAAKALGLSRSALYRRLQRYGL
ncbi:MAG TPA: sigma 54-interacting transcriptional regulator, partial [Gemmatimonadales bacterium]|nr:sigma 54-interacting transcriptional regulator [Gemmatimonadales bacterium]